MKTLIGAYLRLVALFFFLVSPQLSISQIQPRDTTSTDTSRITKVDSLSKPIIPIQLIGSLDRTLAKPQIITDSITKFTDYKYLGDLLSSMPGIIIQDLGSPGQLHGLTLQGLDAHSIAFFNDGILLNDPFTGTFNLNLYPTENIDRIEVIQGTQAFLYGVNSTGAAINIISKSKKAIHPFSRIRYSESAYDYGFIDGMFSQDILRGLNLTSGVQHTTFGGRFANSDYDQWNGQFKLRYNISNEVNVFASEIYNQTRLDLNEGIDLSKTPAPLRFDRIQATVRNTDSYEKITRHDVQCGIATKFAADSDAISTLTFYYSTNLREYRDEENRPNPNGIFLQQDQRSRWFGAKLEQQRMIGKHKLEFGAEVQTQAALISPAINEDRSSGYSVYGKSEIEVLDNWRVTPCGRFEIVQDQHLFSFGGDVQFEPHSWLQLFGGYSRSYILPTIEQREGISPVISSSITNTPERHHLIEVGVNMPAGKSYSFELKFFHRIIWNPIIVDLPNAMNSNTPFIFNRKEKETQKGFDATAAIKLGDLCLEGNTQYLERTLNDEVRLHLPRWFATGGIYFWGKLYDGHLDLKTGFRGRAFTAFEGREFDQQALIYTPNAQLVNVNATGTVDFLLIAHLGNAYIHFIWENLLDRDYIMTIFYPMPDRNIRFGVSWDFLD